MTRDVLYLTRDEPLHIESTQLAQVDSLGELLDWD